MEITQRIRLLLSEMNRGVYEKETEINLSLLAALAGESIPVSYTHLIGRLRLHTDWLM